MKDNNIHQPINLYRWTKKNESTATLARFFHVLVAVGKETENYGSFLQKAGQEGLRLIGKMQDTQDPEPRPLPDVLATPEAMELWEVAQREGWVDERYQPKPSLPRWKRAVLANIMGEMAGIRNKWKVLEAFWQMTYLRQEYQEAKRNDGFYTFLHELERLGGEKMKQTLAFVKRKH